MASLDVEHCSDGFHVVNSPRLGRHQQDRPGSVVADRPCDEAATLLLGSRERSEFGVCSRTGADRTAGGPLVCDGRDVLGGLRGAFLQLADDVGEHLRHLVVRAELDHPDGFLDHNGVA